MSGFWSISSFAGNRNPGTLLWIAAYALLPKLLVTLALAGWVAYITPKVRWLGRQFQDVSGTVA